MRIFTMLNYHDVRKFRHRDRALALVSILAAIVMCLLASAAFSQSPPVTFGASVTHANGELATTLAWDAPGASGCTASGHPEWSGAKTASGTESLPPIMLHGTYSVSISCEWAGDTRALLSWTAPETNTDGTAYENAKGFLIHYGTSPENLGETVGLFVPLQTAYTIEDLTPGTWHFCVRAINTLDVQSECSAIATKTTTANSTSGGSVTLTINPIPRAPLGLEAH
jgi:hypothetical protein